MSTSTELEVLALSTNLALDVISSSSCSISSSDFSVMSALWLLETTPFYALITIVTIEKSRVKNVSQSLYYNYTCALETPLRTLLVTKAVVLCPHSPCSECFLIHVHITIIMMQTKGPIILLPVYVTWLVCLTKIITTKIKQFGALIIKFVPSLSLIT